jgi:hypothetical protein
MCNNGFALSICSFHCRVVFFAYVSVQWCCNRFHSSSFNGSSCMPPALQPRPPNTQRWWWWWYEAHYVMFCATSRARQVPNTSLRRATCDYGHVLLICRLLQTSLTLHPRASVAALAALAHRTVPPRLVVHASSYDIASQPRLPLIQHTCWSWCAARVCLLFFEQPHVLQM